MNFTQVQDPEHEPSQADLQNYDYYLVIYAVSDAMSEFIHNEVGPQLRATNKALCWVIQDRHLRNAASESALNSIYKCLSSDPVFSNDKHSFMAWISRHDFLQGNKEAGNYVPLFMPENDFASQKAMLRDSINTAMKEIHSEKKGNNLDRWTLISRSISVFSVFEHIFKLFKVLG